MTQQEIDFLKNITIEDVEKFYPDVIDEDFQIMRFVIEYDVIQRTDDFPDLIQCLIYVLEETSGSLNQSFRGLKSIHRDMLIDEVLKK